MRYLSLLLLLFCGCSSQNESALPQRERTLALIKPDAVSNHHIGEIITAYERDGFVIVAMKMVKMSQQQASIFYEEHRGRPFYDDLVDYMSSNAIVALVLEGDSAVDKHRKLIGATDPAAAAEGTLRRRFGSSKGENGVHGSDSIAAAQREIALFFSPDEIISN